MKFRKKSVFFFKFILIVFLIEMFFFLINNVYKAKFNKSVNKKTSLLITGKNICDITFIDPNENVSILINFTQNFKPFQTELIYDKSNKELEFINNLYSGGHYEPKNCQPVNRIAIIIPYKDREENLRIFLFNMHPFLQRQQLNYTIFVIEQVNNEKFNKGRLNNAAFIEIIQKPTKNLTLPSDFECIVFHDVDLLPTSFLNLYTCPEKRPKHLSIIVGKSNFLIYYPILVGGVIFFRNENYALVNGYSNKFWGWGAEDDDMFFRLRLSKLGFDRPKNNTNYTMLTHKKQIKNPERVKILKEGKKNYKNDGLNSIRYNLKAFIKLPLFTYLIIDVN